jgi:hypothetical protein
LTQLRYQIILFFKTFQCFIALFSVLVVASAAPQYAPAPPIYRPAPAPAPVYKPAPPPAPVYAPAPAPAYGAAPVYPDVPPAYDYSYAVADDYRGVNFGANENRNGYLYFADLMDEI